MISLTIVVVVMACAGWMAWSHWTYWRTPIRPLPSDSPPAMPRMVPSSQRHGDARQVVSDGHTTIGLREPREQEDSLMATYGTIRGQILARVPGIDPADIPGLLQMLVYTARGPEGADTAPLRHALAGLETLWVEEIADLREAIAAHQRDGLARGLREPAAEDEVMASLRQDFIRGEIPRLSR